MVHEVIIQPEVFDELAEDKKWYRDRSEKAAEELEIDFFNSLEIIAQYPLLCQVRYSDIRIYWLEKFPYGIHFSIEANMINILALIHVKKSPEIWRKE